MGRLVHSDPIRIIIQFSNGSEYDPDIDPDTIQLWLIMSIQIQLNFLAQQSQMGWSSVFRQIDSDLFIAKWVRNSGWFQTIIIYSSRFGLISFNLSQFSLLFLRVTDSNKKLICSMTLYKSVLSICFLYHKFSLYTSIMGQCRILVYNGHIHIVSWTN